MSSKKHGLTTMNASRPKAKPSKKRNKLMAGQRKKQLFNALNEAIHAARGTKPKTAPAKTKTIKRKTTKAKV